MQSFINSTVKRCSPSTGACWPSSLTYCMYVYVYLERKRDRGTHTDKDTQTHKDTQTPRETYTHTPTYTRTHMPPHTETQTDTYTQTYTHTTHTYTDTHQIDRHMHEGSSNSCYFLEDVLNQFQKTYCLIPCM